MLKCNALNVGYVPRPGGDFCLQSHIKARIASAAIIAEMMRMMRMMGLGISLLLHHEEDYHRCPERVGLVLHSAVVELVERIPPLSTGIL